MKASRKTACSIPATGPCAPERTFVAVRAMVPVTQRPPNSAEPMFATPCATSSQFERWRRPVMPSATTADRSDSMAPSSVSDRAEGSSVTIRCTERSGRAGAGRVDGMPPKLLPMVVTSRPLTPTSAAARATAISIPGQCGRHRRSARITATVPSASAGAAGVTVPRADHSAASFGISSPGSWSRLRPSISRIWLARMMTAMPAVKPTVTGKGMNLTKVPSRSSPIAASIIPDRNVARISPSMPCCATMAATSTMKAPAGPPI